MNDAGGQLQDVDKLIGELETQFTVYDGEGFEPAISAVDNCSNNCTHNCTFGCTGTC